MDRESSANGTVKSRFAFGYFGGIAVNVLAFLAGLMAFIFVNMLVFVNWLRYDYVTVSSVLFSFIVFFYTLFGVVGILQAKKASALLSGIFALVVFPVAFSSDLKVYEYFLHPSLSNALNLPRLYRAVVGLPFSEAAGAVGGVLPILRKLIEASLSSSAVNGVGIAVISALLTEYFKRIIFPTPKKNGNGQDVGQSA